jgi:hypothetical protein
MFPNLPKYRTPRFTDELEPAFRKEGVEPMINNELTQIVQEQFSVLTFFLNS